MLLLHSMIDSAPWNKYMLFAGWAVRFMSFQDQSHSLPLNGPNLLNPFSIIIDKLFHTHIYMHTLREWSALLQIELFKD